MESSSKLARPAHSDTMHETCEASLQLDCRATLLLVGEGIYPVTWRV